MKIILVRWMFPATCGSVDGFSTQNLLYALTADVFPEHWKNRMQARRIDPLWHAVNN
jgi:hypothetical protein